MRLYLALIIGLSLASCKAVRSSHEKNPLDVVNPNTPQVGSSDDEPALPGQPSPNPQPGGGQNPSNGGGQQPGQADQPPRIYPVEPKTAPVAPALTAPAALTAFTLRSLPFRQNGQSPRQYRVNLSSKTFQADKLQGEKWVQEKSRTLSGDEVAAIQTALKKLKPAAYPMCGSCGLDPHTLVLEGSEQGRQAKVFGMSQGCRCQGQDERQATLPFADIKALQDLLSRG